MLKQKNVFSCNTTTCLLFVLLLVMSGCATTLSPAAAKIKEAGKETVSECKYLGEVTGTSKVGSETAVLITLVKTMRKVKHWKKRQNSGVRTSCGAHSLMRAPSLQFVTYIYVAKPQNNHQPGPS